MSVLAGLAIGAIAMAQQPSGATLTAEQTELLETARLSALRYSKSLPDFLCTETIHRSEDPFDNGRWRPVDVLKVTVTFAGREDYKVTERNGVPTAVDYLLVGGAITAGEFGTRLEELFVPSSRAEFAWKGWSHVRRRRVALYGYRVLTENSRYLVTSGPSASKATAVITGYHGEVAVDPESGSIMRVSLICDLPKGSVVTNCSSWTEYDYRDVAGRSYLLPVESLTSAGRDRYRASNRIEFHNYRKFQSETSITFK